MSKISHAWVRASLEARITAHVHAWEKARQAGQLLAPETYPFVTISREFGCEGVSLALQLSHILNERCRPFFTWVAYDRELLDRVAEELHLQRAVIESIDGSRRDGMTELFNAVLNSTIDDSVVFRKLGAVIRSLAIHGHCILVGRGSHLITQDLKTGMHVRLVAPRGWRVHQVTEEQQLPQREAAKLVEDHERQRDQFYRTFFVQDPQHPFHHDLIIDNSRFNLDQLAEIIFTALGARFGETLVGA
ncbi:cytidylate kinase-like family protein [bacterium]|nr:cytidylate kinase-like family protein [bacterium]